MKAPSTIIIFIVFLFLFPVCLHSQDSIHSERPDHRILQYWNPHIFTENGKTNVSFFSSDDITGYKVFVEGITSEGKICLGTAEIVVDQKNNQ